MKVFEEMLVNMANENLRKENRPIENMDLVMTVKRWLEEHQTGVHQCTPVDSLGRKKHQNKSEGIGSRQIAEFLLNKGNKVWGHVWINELLKCATLPDWIKEKSEYGETGGYLMRSSTLTPRALAMFAVVDVWGSLTCPQIILAKVG